MRDRQHCDAIPIEPIDQAIRILSEQSKLMAIVAKWVTFRVSANGLDCMLERCLEAVGRLDSARYVPRQGRLVFRFGIGMD